MLRFHGEARAATLLPVRLEQRVIVAAAGAGVVRVARPRQEEDILRRVRPLSLVGGEPPGPEAQGLREPDAEGAGEADAEDHEHGEQRGPGPVQRGENLAPEVPHRPHRVEDFAPGRELEAGLERREGGAVAGADVSDTQYLY